MRLVLTFDRTKVFDAIVAQNGNYGPLGARLVTLLLGDPSGLDRVALLAAYGIEVGEDVETLSLPSSVDDAKHLQEVAELWLRENAAEYFAAGCVVEEAPECGMGCFQYSECKRRPRCNERRIIRG